MSLNLYFHGGKCCGIKVIKGFPHYPEKCNCDDPDDCWCDTENHTQEALKAESHRNNDSYGHDVSSDIPFFTDNAPEEGVEGRFVRLVEFCKRRRPQGAIEIALATQPDGEFDQNEMWGPMLEKHGFKVTVPPFLNSNSYNRVTIYHLVYDTVAEKKASNAPNPFGRRE